MINPIPSGSQNMLVQITATTIVLPQVKSPKARSKTVTNNITVLIVFNTTALIAVIMIPTVWITLDMLVGDMIPEYRDEALDHAVIEALKDLTAAQKDKILRILEILKE